VIQLLAVIGGIGTLGLSAAVVVLAFRYAGAAHDIVSASDLLNDERKLTAQYQHERDVAVAEHDVATALTKQERDLRELAESQRDKAQARVYELLRKHMRDATDDEIRAATADAFAGFDGVPSVPAPDRTGPDALINPFAEVPPP
jgi:hypothetical protein